MRDRRNKMFKRLSKVLNKYINGTKGVISLFMVLVISPLLSISLFLVESARYQDAKERMQEVVDVSAFSTIADYDSYIDERFGLLSVSQKSNINNSFKTYLDANEKALGKSVTINSETSKGVFPLSDTEVLKQQLLEYSEINVAAESMIEGFDLDKLLQELDKSLKTEEIEKEMKALESGMDLTAEVAKLVEAIVAAKDKYPTYANALSEYNQSYGDFEKKAFALAEALSRAESEPPVSGAPVSVYDKSYVKNALSSVKRARNTYKTKAGTLKKELSDFKGYIDKIFNALDSIPAKLQKLNDSTSGAIFNDKDTSSIYGWLNTIIAQATTRMKLMVGNDYKDRVNSEVRKLQEQVIKLSDLNDTTIKSYWNYSKINSEYGPVKISSVIDSFGKDILELITFLNSEANVDPSEKADIKSLLEVARGLFGVNVLYDPSLNSNVDEANLYASTNMSLSSELSIHSMTSLIQASDQYIEGMSSYDIIKAVTAIIPLLKSIIQFLGAVLSWAVESVVNLVRLVASGPKEMYNSLLLYGYGAYNMPGRDGYSNGKTLSGYTYSKVFDLAGGTYSIDSTNSFDTMGEISNKSGSDPMFKGAQAEYLLIGSPSEYYNQSSAFFNLYMLRLLTDFWKVWKNPEVSVMAGATGIGAIVVKVAIVLAEPMLDTIILVNKGKVFLIKDTIYLTPSGVQYLLEELVKITNISTTIKEKIVKVIKGNNKGKKKGMFELSYKDHMLLLLMLASNQEEYMKRIKNLIQMEAKEKHKGDFAFSLDKAYTYIDSDVKYTLNPMFNFDALTKNGLFTVRSKQYIGY